MQKKRGYLWLVGILLGLGLFGPGIVEQGAVLAQEPDTVGPIYLPSIQRQSGGTIPQPATSTPIPTSTPTASPTPSTDGVTIDEGPDVQTTDGYPRFVFSGPDDGSNNATESFECSLNQADFVPCTTPHIVRDRLPGLHQFQVRTAGNRSDVATYTWQVISVFGSDAPGLANDLPLPEPDPNGASFRIKCEFSHASYDDAIVYPNQPDQAHLHAFYGNTGSDAFSTIDSMVSQGESTCQGGTLNRSSYWVPALLAPVYQEGEPFTDHHGQVFRVVMPTSGPHAPDIYYKSAVDDPSAIQVMPDGLRMIAGDGGATSSQGPYGPVRWSCESWTITSADDFRQYIPRCAVGDMLRLTVMFPSCWDGVNLYDPQQAHMAYAEAFPMDGGWTLRCPQSHPVTLPQVSYNFAFPVLAQDAPFGDTRLWRLSSDGYTVTEEMPGGYSAHGDWFMAWHPEIIETWTTHCLQVGRDCAGGNLGNGWRLAGMTPGPGTMPDYIGPHLGH